MWACVQQKKDTGEWRSAGTETSGYRVRQMLASRNRRVSSTGV